MTLRSGLLAFALGTLAGTAQAVDILVPAYFYPSSDPAQSQWDELTAAAAAGHRITAIMNPDNGPGAAVIADYTAAVNAFRAAGGRVLGYVYTCYAGTKCNPQLPQQRSTADVLADAARYAERYAVDGIFLDEMAVTPAALPFYATVAGALRSAHPGWQIVGNPGIAAPADYLAVADTLVTYEGAAPGYAGAAREPWMDSAAPPRQAHLLHGVADETQMRALVAAAAARQAGYVYVTDAPLEPNPWNRLPTYWAAELAAVSAVPEPATWALTGAGALLLAAWRGRRRFNS